MQHLNGLTLRICTLRKLIPYKYPLQKNIYVMSVAIILGLACACVLVGMALKLVIMAIAKKMYAMVDVAGLSTVGVPAKW